MLGVAPRVMQGEGGGLSSAAAKGVKMKPALCTFAHAMSDSDQQHPEQLRPDAAVCVAIQKVIDHAILRFDDSVDTSSECICELLRAQLSKSFAVEVVTITGTDVLNNDVFPFIGRPDAYEDCSVLCLTLAWDNQPLASCSMGTVSRQLSNLTFESGVAVSQSIHVDCDATQEWVPLAMCVACGDAESREASVFVAHTHAATNASRSAVVGTQFSLFSSAAGGEMKHVGQDWSDVVSKCEGHWLLRDRVLGRCWPTFVLLARKIDWPSIVAEPAPPSSSYPPTPSRSPSRSPAASPSPLLQLGPVRDFSMSVLMRDYAGEAALQQSQLDVLEAQLALMEAREARLEVIDARAAEEEGNAGWRQAAIDMSDSVGDLTQQLQQRERDFLDLQVSNFMFIRLKLWG